MTETRETPQNFEDLKKNITGSYPELSIKETKTPGGNLITFEERGSLFAEARSSEGEFEFAFNPDISEKNFITMPGKDSYPEAVPALRRSSGIQDLYKKMFLTPLNRHIHQTGGKNSGFFFSGISSDFIDNPFQKITHRKLASTLIKAGFVNPTEMAGDSKYDQISKHIEAEIAQDSEILGLYRLKYEIQTKSGGKDTIENREYILLLVRGRFTRPTKEGEVRVFHEERDTKIVARKIEKPKIEDESDKLLSLITAYIAEVKARQNPIQGFV